ncbi:hypothetical protein F4801DRAFT_245647 [Xylaria longipes]|nr:hypothetical protein F4801DRAFT_245647 [Xylaria longipes]
MVFFPCHLVTKTSNEELRNFMQNAPNPYQMPDELRMFLEGSGPDGTRSIPHTTFLPILVIEAVMCAEIWCVWASRQQSPMPSPEAFMGLFSPTAAAHVKGLAKRLRKVSTMEVLWDHFLLFYSGSVEFLANYDALKNLARAI